jgi:hypothetical protein
MRDKWLTLRLRFRRALDCRGRVEADALCVVVDPKSAARRRWPRLTMETWNRHIRDTGDSWCIRGSCRVVLAIELSNTWRHTVQATDRCSLLNMGFTGFIEMPTSFPRPGHTQVLDIRYASLSFGVPIANTCIVRTTSGSEPIKRTRVRNVAVPVLKRHVSDK